MARKTGYNPSQYPVAPGPRYSGEYEGLIYDPYADGYRVDKQAQYEYLQSQGYPVPSQPKTPGLADQLIPMGAALVAKEGLEYAGKNVVKPFLENTVLPAIGLGDTATGAAAAMAPASTSVANGLILDTNTGNAIATAVPDATTVGSDAAAPGGFLGLGSSPVVQGGLGALGLGVGGYGMYEAYKEGNPAMGAISGATAGAGLSGLGSAAGLAAIPGVGWAAGIGGLIGLGLGLLNGFGDKDRWKTEMKRQEKLSKSGYEGITPLNLSGGRSKEQMEIKGYGKDFKGWDPKTGLWVNNKFNYSRDEKDLAPWDIAGFSDIIEHIGKDTWNSMSPLDRQKASIDLAEKAIAAGAVREHHGTIDVDWSKVEAMKDFEPGAAWEDYKYNTSVASVLNQVQSGAAPSIEAEIQRRKQIDPGWTDWDKVYAEAKDKENRG